jgi:hypothetical protein
VTINFLEERLVGHEGYCEVIYSQGSDDVGLEAELGGVVGSEKRTVVD